MYEIFEQLLQNHGISTYKISKDTGIPQSIFSRWKNGEAKPKQDKMYIIANYFGVTLDYLMGVDSNTENKISLTDEELKRLQVFKVNDKLKILFEEAQGLEQSDIEFVLDMVKKLKK